MLKKIRNIIFDLDGTLIDSHNVWLEADKKFSEENGKEYDPEVSEKMKDMYFTVACKFLVESLNISVTPEEACRRIGEIVSEAYAESIPLKPYVSDYVRLMKETGIKMCVATSNHRALAESALKRLGIRGDLEFIITSEDVGCGKESGLIFKRAAEMLGADPSETAVFEDSLNALKSAKSAGFYTVGIINPETLWDNAQIAETADKTISSFSELAVSGISL